MKFPNRSPIHSIPLHSLPLSRTCQIFRRKEILLPRDRPQILWLFREIGCYDEVSRSTFVPINSDLSLVFHGVRFLADR